METTRPPGFPGNPPARMPRTPTPARSPPPRPLRCGEIAFRPTHDVGPHNQCISGLNHAAYGLPVNASRPGSPQAHASLGSGWRPTLAGWDWIPTGFRTRFQRSHHGIVSPLTGLSRHTRRCTKPATPMTDREVLAARRLSRRRKPIPPRGTPEWGRHLRALKAAYASHAACNRRGIVQTAKAMRVRLERQRWRQREQQSAISPIVTCAPVASSAVQQEPSLSYSTMAAETLSAALDYSQPLGRHQRLESERRRWAKE